MSRDLIGYGATPPDPGWPGGARVRAFRDLNYAYRERFGFPFVICVRCTNRAGTLAVFHRRLGNGRDEEIDTAIAKIVRLRLGDLT